MNYVCESCGLRPGEYHVTLSVQIVGPKTTKRKLVQFWLCATCERASAQVLEVGPQQRARLARRMTEWPEYLSRWKDWRERFHPDYRKAKP